MWVTKLLIFPVEIRIFCSKKDQIWPKIGIFGQFGPGHAGFFGALFVGRLVVVARGLYLARHLFTLYYLQPFTESYSKVIDKFEELAVGYEEDGDWDTEKCPGAV